jgi:glycosyltransferase involved in cell wall biosynthesis
MSDRGKPWVSILTPVYTGWTFLPEAAGSVFHQDDWGWEWIIGVNGHGPTGGEAFQVALGLAQWAAEHCPGRPVKVYNLPQVSGKVEALNVMVERAQGDWVALLDCDDLWEANKLSVQRTFLNTVAMGAGAIGTLCTYFGDMLADGPPIPLGFIPSGAGRFGNPIVNSSAIVRKDLAVWIETFGLEDYDMWVRLDKAGFQLFNVPMRLVRHRIHKDSAFNGKAVQQIEQFRAFHWP